MEQEKIQEIRNIIKEQWSKLICKNKNSSDINCALKNQILLKEFGVALVQITNSEIQYGKKYYTDNWEIMLNKGATEKYPAIYHGIIREGVKK